MFLLSYRIIMRKILLLLQLWIIQSRDTKEGFWLDLGMINFSVIESTQLLVLRSKLMHELWAILGVKLTVFFFVVFNFLSIS